MTNERFWELVKDQISQCRITLNHKTNEYTPESDRLQAFKQAAHLKGESVQQALYGMMVKHVVSIAEMCTRTDATYARDIWQEKITDNINYLLILWAALHEEPTMNVEEDEKEI